MRGRATGDEAPGFDRSKNRRRGKGRRAQNLHAARLGSRPPVGTGADGGSRFRIRRKTGSVHALHENRLRMYGADGEKAPGGRVKSRWIQLSASLVAMLMIANLQYSWTLFVQPIRAATGWKLSDVQWAFTLYILCQTWVMPLEGWLIDRMGPRIFISAAGVVCGIGWVLMGHARTLAELYGFYALAGIGAAFVYSGSMATGLKWFPDKRGLAAGIIAAGYGSGSAIFIPIIAAIIRQHDYQRAFLYTGIGQGI